MEFTIRPATPADRERVVALASRLEDFGLPGNVPPHEVAAGEARTLHAAFDDMPAGAALLVAEDSSGTLLGAVFLERKIDYFTERPHGHVGILAVTRAAEGRGVGRALLQHADSWARASGYDRLTLFVFDDNRRARALYERAGYRTDLVRYRRDL